MARTAEDIQTARDAVRDIGRCVGAIADEQRESGALLDLAIEVERLVSVVDDMLIEEERVAIGVVPEREDS